MHVTENWVKFLMLQEVILRLIISIQKRQNLNPEKNKKEASNLSLATCKVHKLISSITRA